MAKRIAITGASGNIAYSLLFRLASGEFLGKSQRVILHLHDLPFMEQKLKVSQSLEMLNY